MNNLCMRTSSACTAVLVLPWLIIYILNTESDQAVVINKLNAPFVVPRKALAPFNYQLSAGTWCPVGNNRRESFVSLTAPLLTSASTFSGNVLLRPRNMTPVAMEAKQPQLPKHGHGKWNDTATAYWRQRGTQRAAVKAYSLDRDRRGRAVNK